MKINLRIEFVSGESQEVSATAPDLVAFEDKFNVSIASLTNEPKMSYMLYLAWHSEKRTGGTKDSFEKWLETVDMVGASASDPK